MTILHDECKPTKRKPSDAVVELMAESVWRAVQPREGSHWRWKNLAESYREVRRDEARAILSALSDAGLAVRPAMPTREMINAAIWEVPHENWWSMFHAFHPSQLEKTDES